MIKINEFFREIKQFSGPVLGNAGYVYIDLPEYKSARGIFFQKHLSVDLSGFIEFQLLTWKSPQAMQILLFKNLGEEPLFNPPSDYPPGGIWEIMTLPYLFGTILQESHPQVPDTGLWEFNTNEEMLDQIAISTKVVMKFGLPWLEDF